MLKRRFALALALTLCGGALAACGSNASSEPTRSYTVELRMEDDEDEYHYVAVGEVPKFAVGDRVTFEAANAGTLNHDLQVVGPDGIARSTVDAVAPGDTLSLTVDLDDPGIYQLNCLVDNHLTEHNMQTLIRVDET
jgi:plastocyanin